MRLNEVEVDKMVIYKPYDNCPDESKEIGIITSWNREYIFVKYGNDHHSKATRPNDLIYIED